MLWFCFFFTAAATTEIYTLSLHDALPILSRLLVPQFADWCTIHLVEKAGIRRAAVIQDRKSTRLNSSHPSISYAVFCLKKKRSHVRLHRPPPVLSLSDPSSAFTYRR